MAKYCLPSVSDFFFLYMCCGVSVIRHRSIFPHHQHHHRRQQSIGHDGSHVIRISPSILIYFREEEIDSHVGWSGGAVRDSM